MPWTTNADGSTSWTPENYGVGNPPNPGTWGAPSGGSNNAGSYTGIPQGSSGGGSSGGNSTLQSVLGLAGTLLPVLLSGKNTPTQTASTPSDLLGMRKQQIALLQYLLGFGPDPRTNATLNGTGAAPQSRPRPGVTMATGGVVDYRSGGPVHGPGTGTSDSIPAQLSNGEGVLTANTVAHLGGPAIVALLNHIGETKARQHFANGGVAIDGTPMPSSTPSGVEPSVPGSTTPGITTPEQKSGVVQSPQQRLESFYGPLGITPSPLQNQATNTYSSFLNQPSPWDRAMNVTGPQLQQNLGGNGSTQGAINNLMGLQTGAGADVTGRLNQLSQGGGSQTGSSAMDQVLGQLGQGTTNAQQNLSQIGQGASTGSPQLQAYLNSLAMGQGTGNLAGLGQVNQSAGIDPVVQQALASLSQSNPGQAVVDSLQPLFQQNLAAADQVGGRFGTSNALGRAQATNAFNQTAAQALQTGATQQQQAASSLGQLGSAANQTNMQGAIASAGNQLQGGLAGSNNQLQALGLAQTGNLGQGNLALGANSAIANQQGNATGQSIGAQQGLNQNVLNALSQLGGFNLQGNAQAANNQTSAGNLGLGQGNLSNNAAGIYNQAANNQGTGNLNTANSAFNAGQVNTQQGYQGQQNVINILQSLLGAGQSASIGGPTVSTPSTGQQLASLAPGIAQVLSTIFGSGSNNGTPGYYVPQTGSIPTQTGSQTDGGYTTT